MKALLVRVAEGDGTRVMSELNRLTQPGIEPTTGKTLTCVDFAAKALAVRQSRLEEEAKAKEAAMRRAAKARRRHLEEVMNRADDTWGGLDLLMAQKNSAAYDKVAAQLKELRDAYQQANREREFKDRLQTFRKHYARRPAMMRRIDELL